MNRKENYQVYLKSEKWKTLSENAKALANYHCQLCNATKNLVVHHRQYPKVFGTESLSWLIVLCKTCHDIFHKYRKVRDPYQDNKRRLRRAAKHGSVNAKVQLKTIRLSGPVKHYTLEEIEEYKRSSPIAR